MSDDDAERMALAQRVRATVLDLVLAAYEEAGVSGLCAEGRLDYAIDRARQVDLSPMLKDD